MGNKSNALKQESRKTVQKHIRFDHAETQGKMQQEMKKLTIAQYKRKLENFKSKQKDKTTSDSNRSMFEIDQKLIQM